MLLTPAQINVVSNAAMHNRRPRWVNKSYGGRSIGTSVVPQIADDFGAPPESAESGHKAT